MSNEFEKYYEEALANLRLAFPGQALVDLAAGGRAVGVARTTWHHQASAGRPPFPTTRVGNRRYASVNDLARFVAARLARVDICNTSSDLEHLTSQLPLTGRRLGRPSREEEARARGLGITVGELRRRDATVSRVEGGAA